MGTAGGFPRWRAVSVRAVHVRAMGMACPVGLRWAPACAAIRAGINRKRQLIYRDNDGEPIVGSHLGLLDPSWAGERRWRWLLRSAIAEALTEGDRPASTAIPL